MYRDDTIVACATAPGPGAVAIVRLSGPQALDIGARMFSSRSNAAPEPRRLRLGVLRDPVTGETLDEAMAVTMPGPASYTGEDVVELHSHGSPLLVERIVSVAVALGARLAERGEFTRRAVLNGRMDLLQAEAVADLISAGLEGGARQAWAQLQGALSERLKRLRSHLVEALARVEAEVDFSEDECSGPIHSPERFLQQAADEIRELLEGFPAARRQREGFRTVMVGRPNVGKSSLTNALLGSGRMIVTTEAGTTRDAVDEVVDLGGVAFVLTDTAGLRESNSRAETAAVVMAREKAAEADIKILVLDGSLALGDHDRSLAKDLGETAIIVVNKSDLPGALTAADLNDLEKSGHAVIFASALTGEGCGQIAAALVKLAGVEPEGAPAAISRVRHRGGLEQAQLALAKAVELCAQGGGDELVALEIRAAIGEISALTHPLGDEELLDRIFSEFCVGK